MQSVLLCRGARAATAAAAAGGGGILPCLAAAALRTAWLASVPPAAAAAAASARLDAPSMLAAAHRIHNGALLRYFSASASAASSYTAASAATSTNGNGGVSASGNGGDDGGATADGSQLHVSVEPLSGAHEGVSVISLSRPSARNAIGRQMLRELAEALDTVRQERTTRCVLVRSVVPGVFSSGADLKERATMSQGEAAEFVSRIRRTFTELQDLPMPTVAVVEGLALGGGAELALACDLRVMGSGAAMAFPEAQLGIIPGAGGTQRLPRIVGASRAKELIFTGRRVSGGEAQQLLLADHVVLDEQVYMRALQLAEQIVRSAPLSLRQAKAAVNRGLEVDLHTGLAMEEALYAQLLHTKDRMEGLKAFAEKRKPNYTGE